MTTEKDSDFLNNATEIMDYLGIKSRALFKKYVEMGLPCQFLDNRYYANALHVKAWHLKFTASRIEGEAPEETAEM